ncbi:hypothetical protein N7470_004147 [Penicillium chermesinum]|nr:hypothetical protein N7470_004147 [Penicillium chermesinum]
MASRRPLANVSNSPAKRVRSNQLEVPYGQPPAKKQAMEPEEQETRSPARSRPTVLNGTDSKLFTKRSNHSNPSAFEKKLVAAREKDRSSHVRGAKGEKHSADTLDTIRQWQKHYRKAFPQFVFYFDSIPEDVRRKFSRQVVALGASEEKFFSRLVTHVVTSRPIPAVETATTSPTELEASGTTGESTSQTVNPSLLDKHDPYSTYLRTNTRDQGSMDVLQRARQMNMKIWALEKLQRMITTINDNDIGGQNDHASRGKNAGHATTGRGDADLSRVLRQELLNGPSDRDPLSSMEMLMFKGPFIYIHDMNEKTKPVMIREYPRVARRVDGAWPQFRSAPLGKCPFIDEPPTRKDYDRPKARNTQKAKKEAKPAAESREKADSANAAPTTTAEQDTDVKLVLDLCKPKQQEEQPLSGRYGNSSKPLTEEGRERKSSESFIPPHIPRTGPFYTGREPAASGVQPSNITSAIRSQMISSTAAAPGAKAGLSKEIHGLKRKVLDKGNGMVPPGPMAAPQRPGASAGTQAESNQCTKTSATDKNGEGYDAKSNASENFTAGTKRRREESQELPKKPERRRDPKPGYCENCRDKFDDFEEHTLTRKHRRFAQNSANWAELDALLFEIQRPLKETYDLAKRS